MIKTTSCLVIATANTTISIVRKKAVEYLRVGAHILVHWALGPTKKPVAVKAIIYVYTHEIIQHNYKYKDELLLELHNKLTFPIT